MGDIGKAKCEAPKQYSPHTATPYKTPLKEHVRHNFHIVIPTMQLTLVSCKTQLHQAIIDTTFYRTMCHMIATSLWI